MIEFNDFELETILVHLSLCDTIFGETPVRNHIMDKIKDALE